MLKHIPFYASLLEQPVGDKTTNSHVLVYGAIEAHSFGEKGCIASNAVIGKETGLGTATVANIISALAKARWVKVDLNDKNQRVLITPLLVITTLHSTVNPPSLTNEPPLHSPVNIDYSKENTVRTTTNVVEPKANGYGRSDINDMFDYWQTVTGIPIAARIQHNRFACNNLLKKHGADKLRHLIGGVAATQNDRYAPRIADFAQLQAKLGDLLLWGRKQTNELEEIEI